MIDLPWSYAVEVGHEAIGMLWAAGEIDEVDFTLGIRYLPERDVFIVQGTRENFAASAVNLMTAANSGDGSRTRFITFIHDLAAKLDDLDDQRAENALWN